MTPADRAWIALGVGVLAWDLLCDEGQTLSEAADRWMLTHPWLVRGTALLLVSHVCNLAPPKYDLIHQLFRLKRLNSRR